jgi:hypothetical protein
MKVEGMSIFKSKPPSFVPNIEQQFKYRSKVINKFMIQSYFEIILLPLPSLLFGTYKCNH